MGDLCYKNFYIFSKYKEVLGIFMGEIYKSLRKPSVNEFNGMPMAADNKAVWDAGKK